VSLRSALLILLLGGCYRASAPADGVAARDGAADEPRGDGLLVDAPRADAALDAPSPLGDASGFDAPSPFGDASAFDADPRDAPRADAPLRDAPPADASPFDVPRPDAPPIDAPPVDAPVSRPDAPPFDAPLDTPPVVPTDAPRPTSLARECRGDSVMTMLDHPLFASFDSTLELWVRVRGPGVIARKGEGDRRHYELVVATSAEGRLVLRAGWGTERAERILEVPAEGLVGRWSHLALVHRTAPSGAVTLELYVNAVLAAEGAIPGLLSDAFNSQAFLFCTFDGDVDEIRFWGGALAASLIEARRFGSVPPDSPGLLAYWPLDTRGQVIFDRALSGADGVAGSVSTAEPSDPRAIADGAF
jgi:hypothetical protein